MRDEDGLATGSGKSKKKNLVIDDDEYSMGTQLSEEASVMGENGEVEAPNGGKKKGMKGNLKEKNEDDDDRSVVEENEEDISNAFAGKKSKSKKGGSSGFSKASFVLLEDGNQDKNENGQSEDEDLVISSGKKSSKGFKKGGSLFSSSTFDVLDDEQDYSGDTTVSDERPTEDANKSGDDDEIMAITFSGKKKKSKSGKEAGVSGFSASNFDALDEDKDANDETVEEDVSAITFTGKKKKKSSKSLKKPGTLFSAVYMDEENAEAESMSEPHSVNKSGSEKSVGPDGQDNDETVIAFTGKKKSSKKKSSATFVAVANEAIDDIDPRDSNVVTEMDDSKMSNEARDVAETSKNKKKKKKKSGRTAEEEEDLDKILAELGEGPSVSKPAPAPASAQAKVPSEPAKVDEGTADKDGEEGVGESAAAKKKKKKKEKEKEKKAAAAAVKEEKQEEANETKSKGIDKKLPKHVREMQEALARRKEAEERKKREEEEKLRKEEEERKRQEELQRQAEEAKRKKKEREKEKMLKKKQEGKLLTGKQKEEQRRLEAMRNQFLSNKGFPLPATDNESKPSKRPIYATKKSKTHQIQTTDSTAKNVHIVEEENKREAAADADSAEAEKVNDADMMSIEDNAEAAAETKADVAQLEEEEDEEEEEWDAKSWDDADLSLPNKRAFEDEDADSESESVAKEHKKIEEAAVRDAGRQSTAAQKRPTSSEMAENKKNLQVKAGEKNRKNDGDRNHVPASSVQCQQGNLRSPICCIMGHVDTGKTKLLDRIRGTNVQEGEAGGITQQIGATYFPAENIRDRTRELKADAKLNVPGLLVIDTPGHESFTNLRSRGSGLCDIAILVVDIMHGLEPQTIESLNLLKMRNTEFIVALNKVDRLYGWKTCRNAPIIKAMKQQPKDVQNEFNMRLMQIITQFKEQGLNTELYYKNKEMGETFSIVPTSAISGEGIPDLLLLLVQWTQKTMIEKLTFSDEVQCTVLEVKVVEGHGTTIDVVLVNGVLHEGDQIVVCGMQGPIVTTIRALLTPHPMKELRVKGTYLHHKEIKAAQGIKITAQGLEHAIAGTGLYVVERDDDLEEIKELAMEDMQSVMSRIDKSGEGVCVQASTLGSLEALLEFLKSPAVNIPVSGISIGPVHKKDVMKASVMLEKKKEYATILAFDVKVTPEAREYADDVGVRIFMADIIYHLFDQFKAYIDNLREERKKEAADEAVFPCVLKIMPNCVFNKKDPIVVGVDVLEGIVKVGTPICVPSQDFINIGRIASIEHNKKAVDIAKRHDQVAIKIVGSTPDEQQKMFGRHFEIDDELVSHISRRSIDILKANYRDDLSMEDWKLVVKLKGLFKIQ